MTDNEIQTLYSHRTLKIGEALKWRGVYDNALTYYRDNVVVMCSCVFWCRQLFTRGVPPLVYRSSDRMYQFANTETWVCLVDNLWLYNNNKKLVQIYDEYAVTKSEMEDLIGRANEALGAYDDYIIGVVHDELNRLRVGALDLKVYSTEGQLFRKGAVDTIVYAKIYCNQFDVTDVCSELVHNYTWSRDTKDSAEDRQWSKSAEVVSNGLGIRVVDDGIDRHDLGSKFFSKRQKCKFTINVSVAIDDTGIITEAQKSLNII